MPFDSGTILVTVLLSAAFYFGLSKRLVTYNTLIYAILVLIGFSTWTMLPVRANANVIINETKPSDAREVTYYNREQYGSNPLFYGPQYTEVFCYKDNPYLDKV
jgi:hypothetical protein